MISLASLTELKLTKIINSLKRKKAAPGMRAAFYKD